MGESRGRGAAAVDPRFFGTATVTESPVRCVITRMRLQRPWHVVSAYRAYRALRRAAQRRHVPGLLKTAFLIEGARTCCNLSVWEGEPVFSAHLPEHVDAVNAIFARLAYDEARGPELWSTTWRLDAISHNQRWDDLDLVSRIGRHRLRPARGQPRESGEERAMQTGGNPE